MSSKEKCGFSVLEDSQKNRRLLINTCDCAVAIHGVAPAPAFRAQGHSTTDKEGERLQQGRPHRCLQGEPVTGHRAGGEKENQMSRVCRGSGGRTGGVRVRRIPTGSKGGW